MTYIVHGTNETLRCAIVGLRNDGCLIEYNIFEKIWDEKTLRNIEFLQANFIKPKEVIEIEKDMSKYCSILLTLNRESKLF